MSLNSEHPTVLILFDLDHFKQINDRFGHLMGDQVLASLCDICHATLRENDLLARFGGEEFIDSDTRFESLLQRADSALYQAKHAGRNRVCAHK